MHDGVRMGDGWEAGATDLLGDRHGESHERKNDFAIRPLQIPQRARVDKLIEIGRKTSCAA